MNNTIILTNGSFPHHEIPLSFLCSSNYIICCDGASNALVSFGQIPNVIIGDLDSINTDVKLKFHNNIIHLTDQSNSDLEKAIKYSLKKNILKIICLGISGLRDDHFLSNIFLLWEYSKKIQIEIFTDYGKFSFINNYNVLQSFPGQEVSIFSLDPKLKITTKNLKYSIKNDCLKNLFKGCSNSSTSDTFTITCKDGIIMVYQKYR